MDGDYWVMCGLCGFFGSKKYGISQLKKMNDSMIHRGPDDSGILLEDARNGWQIGLAHRRLSIIDLTEQGHQPMTSNDGRLTVVFNGEIYNFKELRKEISEYKFVSESDTEIILAAYLKWGNIDFINHINGMFAIAVYDREKCELNLYRDRVGKKPLYYWVDGNSIVFASELKPIMYCSDFRKC